MSSYSLRRSPLWSDPREKPAFGTAQLDRNHVLAQGCVGKWLCNETQGNFRIKDIAQGTDGVMSGLAAAWPPGRVSTAPTYSGGDDFILFSSEAKFASKPMSFSIWAKPNGAPAQFDGIAASTNLGNWTQGWGMFWNSATEMHFFIETWNVNVAVSVAVTNTVWSHFVGTWDGTTIQIYVNGVAGTSDAYSGAITSGNPFEVGRAGTNSLNFNGQLDDISIYNRALTQDEVLWLYSEPFIMLKPVISRRVVVPAAGRTTRNTHPWTLGVNLGMAHGFPGHHP